jgi:hypothetical protein
MPSTSPLANLPGARARRLTMRQRRVRALGILTVVVLFAVLLATCLGGGSGHSTASTPSTHGTTPHHGATIPAATSSVASWKLLNPLSRAILLPGSDTQLVILGGLTASGASAQGVYTLDTATGKLAHVGNLTGGLHDSSGAVIGGQDYAFGGGSPSTIATVQAIAAPGPSPSAALAAAKVVGTLPQPRSDSATVTVGTTTYVVGGYDGTNPDPEVLATPDGTTFASVVALAVPVRYPAVAAVGGNLYVFGGQAVTGAGAGTPVDDIQEVDPARHTATVVGHLPSPVAAAAAVLLGNQIYLAGGDGPAQAGSVPSSTTASSAGEKSTGTSTVSTIWAFDVATKRMLSAGQLHVPVSHSCVAVLGSTAWLVGGETNGTSVATVQVITPNPSANAS